MSLPEPRTSNAIIYTATCIPVLAGIAVLLSFILKSFVMAVLDCCYYVGTVVLSGRFVAPVVVVGASALGCMVASSCTQPIGEAS